MTKQEFKELVRRKVEESTGIKATVLAVDVAQDVGDKGDFDIWGDALTPLINEGEVVELEYVLPNMDYRIKSIFFPEGTTLGSAGQNIHLPNKRRK